MSNNVPSWPRGVPRALAGPPIALAGPPIALVGPRIALDPLSLEHEDALRAVAADGDLWKIPYTVVPHPDRVRSYIETALQRHDRGTDLPWVMRVIATGRIVGTGRFQFMVARHRKLQIGSVWVARSWQGKYVAPETVLTALTYAFEVLRTVRVEFILDPDNRASRKLLARLGAREEGVLRNHLIMPDGRVRDSIMCSILEREWPAVKLSMQQRLAARFAEPLPRQQAA